MKRRFDDPSTKEIAKTVSYEVVNGDNGMLFELVLIKI